MDKIEEQPVLEGFKRPHPEHPGPCRIDQLDFAFPANADQIGGQFNQVAEIVFLFLVVGKVGRLRNIIQRFQDDAPGLVDVLGIIAVFVIAERPQHLVFDHIGKTDDGAERGADLMGQRAHQIQISFGRGLGGVVVFLICFL